jgi:hypothetical protein
LDYKLTRIQRQSEGFKYGDTGNHSLAVERTKNFIIKQNPKADVYEKWNEKYPADFVRREKINWTPEHEYDLAVQIGLKWYYIDIHGESHGEEGIRGHEQRKEKDGMAKKFAEEVKKIKYIVLRKRELIGDEEDAEIWLMQNLWKYIK